MLFPDRVWGITDLADGAALAQALGAFSAWTLCTGFRLPTPHGSYLVLNDSTSEDGAQEFAFLQIRAANPPTTGGIAACEVVQVESLTVSWCAPATLPAAVAACLGASHPRSRPLTVRIDGNLEHRCHFCE